MSNRREKGALTCETEKFRPFVKRMDHLLQRWWGWRGARVASGNRPEPTEPAGETQSPSPPEATSADEHAAFWQNGAVGLFGPHKDGEPEGQGAHPAQEHGGAKDQAGDGF